MIDDWKGQGCLGEIARRLGYRFVATDLWWDAVVAAGGTLRITLRIRNDGFAAPFNKRPVAFVLQGAAMQPIFVDADPRLWGAAETTDVSAEISVPSDLLPGAYRLALWMPDKDAALQGDPRYSIQLADEGLWDAATGFNILADVTVR